MRGSSGAVKRDASRMPDPHLPLDREAFFPNLRRGEYQVTSLETSIYNCIAHAAGKDDNWWWPDEGTGIHWPIAMMEVTLDAFVAAYATEGYVICETQSRDLEPGVEKVAIYVDGTSEPTHAARQLPDGSWTSKLGDWEDIRHERLEAMEDLSGAGLGYGRVAMIMRRPAQAT